MVGRVEEGKSGGGLCYGYRVVRASDGTTTGEREIEPGEASVVTRIFREFLAGVSPKRIAQRLNSERVPGPAGRGWNPSTIHGNAQRGTGILNNELYIGRIVWNRLRYVKDPDTGRRVSRLNSRSEWIEKEVRASGSSMKTRGVRRWSVKPRCVCNPKRTSVVVRARSHIDGRSICSRA
jgi:site-specific DNA recombinase